MVGFLASRKCLKAPSVFAVRMTSSLNNLQLHDTSGAATHSGSFPDDFRTGTGVRDRPDLTSLQDLLDFDVVCTEATVVLEVVSVVQKRSSQ